MTSMLAGMPGGTACEASEQPVTQPTASKSPDPFAVDPTDPETETAKEASVMLNIRSNAQVFYKDVRIGAGNFLKAEHMKSGRVRKPASAKLWTAVKSDTARESVIRVSVGDSFTVGDHRFIVKAINIPPSETDPKVFTQAGGNKASITVLAESSRERP